MKKLMLSALLAVFAFSGLKAQSSGFETEVFIGFPMGDKEIKDAVSLNIGINAGYYWEVSESFKLGAILGYDYLIGKKDEGEKHNLSYLPIAASGKFFIDQFFIGLDLGYAIGVSSDYSIGYEEGDGVIISSDVKYKGGFMFRPRIGFTTASFDVFAFYKSINNKTEVSGSFLGESFSVSDKNSIGTMGVGFVYKF